jgi:hypothetical protein
MTESISAETNRDCASAGEKLVTAFRAFFREIAAI